MARDEPTDDAEAADPAHSAAPPAHSAAPPATRGTWRGRRFGSYEPILEIARGGMGAVFAAHAHDGPAAGTVVALKLLRRDLAATHRRAFLREARVTSSLDHPNVVRTFDVGETDGDVYLAMELVSGVTLAQLLARLDDRGIAPSPWLGAFIVASAARGLHAAHELCSDDGRPLHLVHRDVSPQNILLDFDGRVLLADFGIAKFAHDGTTSVDGTLKGKFSYMSPEQIRADSLDRRSDVFALGAVLYEALTGRHAFGGRGPAEIVAQVLHGGAHDPREQRPDLPERMARTTARCMATERDDRYATVADVAADLEVALADAPGSPAELLVEVLSELFAKERDRFDRLRRREVWAAKTTPASAMPAPVAPAAPVGAVALPAPVAPVALPPPVIPVIPVPAARAAIHEPSTLDSGDARPLATLPSAAAIWTPPTRPSHASIRVTEAPSLPPSPWRTRVTWMLFAVVAGVVVVVVVLASGVREPAPTAGSATMEGGIVASASSASQTTSPGSAASAPVAPVAPVAPDAPVALVSATPVVASAVALPAASTRVTSGPSARGPGAPAPRPTAAPSGGVFREW